MKRLSAFLVLGLVVALSAGLANATINLPAGRNTGHLFDASNLYWDHDGNPATPSVPRPITIPAITPAIGDENRSVVAMDSFEAGGSTAWSHDTPNQLTGLFYDLVLVGVSPGPTGFTLWFSPLGRNPIVSDVDGDIAGISHGGVLEFYEDNPSAGGTAFDDRYGASPGPAAGPGAWVEGQSTASRDSYPNASDGSLWLSGVLVEVPGWTALAGAGVPIVWRETINFVSGVGTGEGYMNVFGGSYEENIGRGTFNHPGIAPAGADVQLLVNVDVAFVGPGYGSRLDPAWGWQIESNDPVRLDVNAIPEPTIMLLFGGSILGGLMRRRRGL